MVDNQAFLEIENINTNNTLLLLKELSKTGFSCNHLLEFKKIILQGTNIFSRNILINRKNFMDIVSSDKKSILINFNLACIININNDVELTHDVLNIDKYDKVSSYKKSLFNDGSLIIKYKINNNEDLIKFIILIKNNFGKVSSVSGLIESSLKDNFCELYFRKNDSLFYKGESYNNPEQLTYIDLSDAVNRVINF